MSGFSKVKIQKSSPWSLGQLPVIANRRNMATEHMLSSSHFPAYLQQSHETSQLLGLRFLLNIFCTGNIPLRFLLYCGKCQDSKGCHQLPRWPLLLPWDKTCHCIFPRTAFMLASFQSYSFHNSVVFLLLHFIPQHFFQFKTSLKRVLVGLK